MCFYAKEELAKQGVKYHHVMLETINIIGMVNSQWRTFDNGSGIPSFESTEDQKRGRLFVIFKKDEGNLCT